MGVKQVAMTNISDWALIGATRRKSRCANTQARQCNLIERIMHSTVPGVRVLYDFGLPVETLYYDVYRNNGTFLVDVILRNGFQF